MRVQTSGLSYSNVGEFLDLLPKGPRMSDNKPAVGTIGWIDLTVGNAREVRDFYAKVVGWDIDPVPMGDYEDWCMSPSEADPVAGICHSKGDNANQPPVWMMYIVVKNLDKSLANVEKLGGAVVVPTREMGEARFTVIRDPAGAVCALYQA